MNKSDRHTFSFSKDKPQLAVLIDPDKQTPSEASSLAKGAEIYGADFIFVGGSLVGTDIPTTVASIKQQTSLPVILFPGHSTHICNEVDCMLLLTLLSGRNPEFLIGNHVIAAPTIKRLNIPTISCGYILIETGTTTSVEYISNTKPIPQHKPEIVVATAIAGELIGNNCIYLEGGSGADSNVNKELIEKVKASISVPLIVGGGIKSPMHLRDVFLAGANIAVIGTALEQSPQSIKEFCDIKQNY